jgi:hypothetical protein
VVSGQLSECARLSNQSLLPVVIAVGRSPA